MWNSAFVAARHWVVRHTHFEEMSLEEDNLQYVAVSGQVRRAVSTEWSRRAWLAPHRMSCSLLGLPSPEDALQAACELDWEERTRWVSFACLEEGSLRFVWNQGEVVIPAESLDFDRVIGALAIRRGYHVQEIPGEGLAIHTPQGRVRAVQGRQCDCADGLARLRCAHRILGELYLSHRPLFLNYFKECQHEYASNSSGYFSATVPSAAQG
jgi:hypothetical protein